MGYDVSGPSPLPQDMLRGRGAMIGEDKERWRDLCKRAVRKHDLGELLKLIEESHQGLLEGEDQRRDHLGNTFFAPEAK